MTKSGKKKKGSGRHVLVHGVDAREVLLPWDSKHDFLQMHNDLRAEFLPHGRAEEEAVLDLAFAYWRKRTLWRMQRTAVLRDSARMEIAGVSPDLWRRRRRELRAMNKSEGSLQSIAADTVHYIRGNLMLFLRDIREMTDPKEIKKLDQKVSACIRLLTEQAGPVLRLATDLPPFENIYSPNNMEKIVQLETMLDVRIAKILARLVGLKEFKRTPAAAGTSQLDATLAEVSKMPP